MFRSVKTLTTVAAVAACSVLAACGGGGGGGGSSNTSSPSPSPSPSQSKASAPSGGGGGKSSGSIEVDAVWSGAEQKTFQKVIDAFTAKTGIKVTYSSQGDNLPTVLGTKLAGGKPPDVAMLPQPGLLDQFAKKGVLKKADPAVAGAVKKNYSSIWTDLGSVNGTLYGVWIDVANKSTVWYNTKAFDNAGIKSPPATWNEFIHDANTLSDAGVPVPISIGGADGWTLTDWFENVYLQTAGPTMYDKLAKHQIKWTDPSVTKALNVLSKLWSNKRLVGDPTKALQVDFPTSVTNVFAKDAQSAIVYEGSFAAGVISSSTKAKVGTDAKFFPFPTIGGAKPAVVGSGDVAVAFTDNPGAQKLREFLASPEAAKAMVSTGSFTSANSNLDPSAYPDPTIREVGTQIVQAGNNFRFDMSDQAPASFGATKGSGEWKDLQDFLAKPGDVAGAQRKLEADAAKAFK
jgi:multiple sugar transport system substrate-binding protein/alpha-glucoside transport system substrate-binding protein